MEVCFSVTQTTKRLGAKKKSLEVINTRLFYNILYVQDHTNDKMWNILDMQSRSDSKYLKNGKENILSSLVLHRYIKAC